MPDYVAIPGLQRLRQDLRALNRGVLPELRKVEVEAAQVVAKEAARRAPKGTRPLPANRKKRLSEAVQPLTRGVKVQVGATAKQAPHANVNHWGGTIKPRGTDIEFPKSDPRRQFIIKAYKAKRPEFVAALAKAFSDLARRHGL